MARNFVLHCDDGSEKPVPFKWIICSSRDGHGKSTRYLGAFSAEQMREDPDFAEDYFSGAYDRACDDCAGSGKEKVADLSKMNKADREAWHAQCRDIAEMHAIHRAETAAERWAEERGAY